MHVGLKTKISKTKQQQITTQQQLANNNNKEQLATLKLKK
jgi:hypothetical protein